MQTLFVHMKLLANLFYYAYTKEKCVKKFIVYVQYSRKFAQK